MSPKRAETSEEKRAAIIGIRLYDPNADISRISEVIGVTRLTVYTILERNKKRVEENGGSPLDKKNIADAPGSGRPRKNEEDLKRKRPNKTFKVRKGGIQKSSSTKTQAKKGNDGIRDRLESSEGQQQRNLNPEELTDTHNALEVKEQPEQLIADALRDEL